MVRCVWKHWLELCPVGTAGGPGGSLFLEYFHSGQVKINPHLVHQGYVLMIDHITFTFVVVLVIFKPFCSHEIHLFYRYIYIFELNLKRIILTRRPREPFQKRIF